jgi:hypothetical protein
MEKEKTSIFGNIKLFFNKLVNSGEVDNDVKLPEELEASLKSIEERVDNGTFTSSLKVDSNSKGKVSSRKTVSSKQVSKKAISKNDKNDKDDDLER